jgi:hypothetical protein
VKPGAGHSTASLIKRKEKHCGRIISKKRTNGRRNVGGSYTVNVSGDTIIEKTAK